MNEYPEDELADIIYRFGEERFSRRIARAVAITRKSGPITTSMELAEIIIRSVPPSYKNGPIHPATRTFQALRIAVNGELARLESALADALSILAVGGRIGVISFHSLEDRIVKTFFRERNKSCTCPPDAPICICGGRKIVEILTKKPVRPSEAETRDNPPSRSAKFRVAEKIAEEEE